MYGSVIMYLFCFVSDVNECEHDHGCSPDANCVNFHGGYFCLCKEGFHGNGRVCNGESNKINCVSCNLPNAYCRC